MKGIWEDGDLPTAVTIGDDSTIKGPTAFKRFFGSLTIGRDCEIDGAQFSIGKNGQITIGDNCHLTNVILMCELEIRIGNRVIIGWNTAIADSDFHPIDPAQRIADAIACSPAGRALQRPPIQKKIVIIEDDVWIGPAATILKGVKIGTGAIIYPGAMVTRDVPAAAQVLGNPAQAIGET